MNLTTTPDSPAVRRWLTVLMLVAGVGGLFVSLALRSTYAEFGRLIVSAVVAPAGVVIQRSALFSGALLLSAPLLGRWRPNRRRTLALSLGSLGILLSLFDLARGSPAGRTEVVRYPSSDIEVEASLRLPKGAGPFPAVVMVHGSAPFRRGFYAQWADSLVGRGIAVLVPDKRGVGGSGGTLETRNNAARVYLELLASDIVSGVRFLSSRPDINARQIGLLGISQGGWVAPLAAAQDSRIAFLVLLSGPATSTGEENTWSELRGDHDGPAVLNQADANDSLMRTPPRGFNPRPVIAGVQAPSLWLFGSDDNSVPTAKSVAALDSLARGGAPVQWQVLDGADHVLIRHDGPLGLLYTDPRAWPVWLDWVQRRAKGDG